MPVAINIKFDGDGAWPDLADRKDDIIHLANDSSIDLAVLPGGMASGRLSCAFRIDLPDGKVVICETSWRLLVTAVRAIAVRYGWPV